MANESVEEEDLSKEVAVFLDKNVGVEKETTSKIYSLLQDALMKKKCLETEVCYPNNSLKLKVSLRLRFWLLAWRCIFSRRFSSNNLKRWPQVFFFYLGLNFRQKNFTHGKTILSVFSQYVFWSKSKPNKMMATYLPCLSCSTVKKLISRVDSRLLFVYELRG